MMTTFIRREAQKKNMDGQTDKVSYIAYTQLQLS